jgi:hypothetical protein
MKLFKKNRDERQEAEERRINSVAFWIAYWGLVAVIIVQLFVFELDITHIAGEFIILCAAGIYMTIAGYRRGIWDSFTKPGMKSYFAYSFAAVFVLNLPIPLVRYFRYHATVPSCLYSFARNFIILFPLAFAAAAILGALTKRKQKKLAEKYVDDAN